MNKHEIFRFIDHTLLKQNAVWEKSVRLSGGNGLWNGLGMYPTFFCEAGRGICGRKTSYLHGDRVSERIPDNGSEGLEAAEAVTKRRSGD